MELHAITVGKCLAQKLRKRGRHRRRFMPFLAPILPPTRCCLSAWQRDGLLRSFRCCPPRLRTGPDGDGAVHRPPSGDPNVRGANWEAAGAAVELSCGESSLRGPLRAQVAYVHPAAHTFLRATWRKRLLVLFQSDAAVGAAVRWPPACIRLRHASE
jgi:hypothetical protein